MSLRYLYRKYGSRDRVCRGCGKTIQRNIAIHQGEFWHYGCLMEDKQKRYRCLDCYRTLSTLETTESSIMGHPVRSCGYCGSTQIQPLSTWSPQTVNILHGRLMA